VRELAVDTDEAVARARAIFAALGAPPGVPNFYGEQRFGREGDNAARGRAILRGERPPGPPPRDGREKRLLLSSVQSELYNAYLAARLGDGTFARVIDGDWLAKVASGGVFECEDPAIDQPRLEAGEVVPTGPMFGKTMRTPRAGSAAAALEDAVLAAAGLARDDFSRHGLLEGTRRPLAVPLADATVSPAGERAVRVSFGLPAGSYATVVAAELMKADAGGPPA
jgi:tRNA pseudouridine13 synthase